MGKKKNTNKKQNKARKAILQVKTLLAQGKNVHNVISKYRTSGNISVNEKLAYYLLDIKKYSEKKYQNSLQVEFKDLYRIQQLNTADLEVEIAWAKASFLYHQTELQQARKCCVKFEQAFLSGKFEDADVSLDELKEKVGDSMWGVKSRINLYQYAYGVERQKEYFNELKLQAHGSGLAAFIAYYLSCKAEPSVLFHHFKELFDQILEELEDHKDLFPLLSYHLMPGVEFRNSDFAELLRIEATSSVLDYYEVFLFIMQNLLADEDPLGKKMLNHLISLNFDDWDSRLGVLSSRKNNVPSEYINSGSIDAYALLLCNSCDKAIELGLEAIREFPDDFFAHEVVATALAISGEKLDPANLSFEICNRMSGALTWQENATRDVFELVKLSSMYYYTNFGKKLFTTLFNEFNNDFERWSRRVPLFADIANPYLEPRVWSGSKPLLSRTQVLMDNLKHGVVRGYLEFFSNDIGVFNDKLPISKSEQAVAIIQKYFDQLSVADAERLCEVLEKTNLDYYKAKSLKTKALKYLVEENVHKLLTLYGEHFSGSHYLDLPLPLERSVKLILRTDQDISGELGAAILLDAYHKRVSQKYEAERRDAYSDFLFEKNVSKPSELECTDSFSSKLVYFLKHLCVESVMDCSPAFCSSKEVALERIEVCKLLIQYDSNNTSEYQEEIKNIHKRLAIKARTQELEKSKIYVNVEGLKEVATRDIKELFERCVDLLWQRKDGDLQQDLEQIVCALSSMGFKTLSVPKDELQHLLAQVLRKFVELFSLNDEYGLNYCLSLQIRHGTLSGYLRAPLEGANVITKKDGTSGEYLPNESWNLSHSDVFKNKKVQEVLATLSKEYDEFIKAINDDLVQIRRKSKPHGYFSLNFEYTETQDILKSIDNTTSFSTFFDVVLEQLLIRLEACLKIVRHKFKKDLKYIAIHLIEKAELELNEFKDDAHYAGLFKALTQGKTALGLTFDRLAKWFTLGTAEENKPFLFEEALTVSEESIQICGPVFRLGYDIEDVRDIIVKGSFPALVDVFFNIFQNTKKHSKLEFPEADVCVTCSEGCSDLFVNIVNGLGEECDMVELHQTIEDKKDKIRTGEYIQYVSSETGTGIFKIYKLLTQHFCLKGTSPKFKLHIDDDERTFTVTFAIPSNFLERGDLGDLHINY